MRTRSRASCTPDPHDGASGATAGRRTVGLGAGDTLMRRYKARSEVESTRMDHRR